MNANAKKWVAKLESGEYEQAIGALCVVNDDGTRAYCCLGVATDMYQQEVGGLTEREIFSPVTGLRSVEYSDDRSRKENALLLPDVCDWLGLQSASGSYNNGIRQLSADNDEGHPFVEIANTIRTQSSLFKDKDKQ